MTDIILPVATSKIVTPSSLNTNYSFSNIGENIAVKTIVKQEVDAIKIIFPRTIAATFDN
jgi:hypothetical protein